MSWGAWIFGGVAALLVAVTIGAYNEEQQRKGAESAQATDLAVQKVKVADLERRVRQLEEDMDRIAPHRVPTP